MTPYTPGIEKTGGVPKKKHLGYIAPCGKRSKAIEVVAVFAEYDADKQKEIDKKIIQCLFGI